METIQKCCLVLTVIGAINWGLIGLLNLNLVTLLFSDSLLTNVIYVLIGVSGIINIGILFNHIQRE